MNNIRYTIALDFDGVIHKYSKGWNDGTCYDDPFDGVLEAIASLLKDYNVFILSTRPPEQIYNWLCQKKPPFPFRRITEDDTKDSPYWNPRVPVVGITNRKLVAKVYVDDRALLYEPVYNWINFESVIRARMTDHRSGVSTASQGTEDPARETSPTEVWQEASDRQPAHRSNELYENVSHIIDRIEHGSLTGDKEILEALEVALGRNHG